MIGWWHCSAGASGDMMLGALVDAGVPLATVQAAVDEIPTEAVTLHSRQVERHGLAATLVTVEAPVATGERSWASIRHLLEAASLSHPVRELALDVFARLATAESLVHRTPVDDVHFHEVGGLDAIADIVGASAGIVALGLTGFSASPVTLGYGTARGEHGVVPVPGPAVLSLLGAVGAPVHSGDAPYEMCTPTGAALLAATVTSWGVMPAMRVTTVGTGAGGRDPAETANVLRLVIGEPTPVPGAAPSPTAALVIECNVDDLDPRLWPTVLSRLLDHGASDAWLTPILMKKGRPAHTLSVLVPEAEAQAVRQVIFTETSTLGLREVEYGKRVLTREFATVTVEGVPVRIKIGRLDGAVVNAQPEYEDVVVAATKLGRPVKAVLAAATAAAHEAGHAP